MILTLILLLLFAWGGCCPVELELPDLMGPLEEWAPCARVGPADAFRGAVGKDLRVPLRTEGRARPLRGPHPRGAQPDDLGGLVRHVGMPASTVHRREPIAVNQLNVDWCC